MQVGLPQASHRIQGNTRSAKTSHLVERIGRQPGERLSLRHSTQSPPFEGLVKTKGRSERSVPFVPKQTWGVTQFRWRCFANVCDGEE